MRRRMYRVVGTALALGLWVGVPTSAFAAQRPATTSRVQTTVPVETGGILHFLGHLVKDVTHLFGGSSHGGSGHDLAALPVTKHHGTYSLHTPKIDQQLPVLGALLGQPTNIFGVGGSSLVGRKHSRGANSHVSTTSTTQTWISGAPVTSTVQTVNPGQVLGGSGILTSFNGSGIPGQQLINNGFHTVNVLFSSTSTGVAGGQVTAASVASTLPPNTQRLFAKTLVVVSENNNQPWKTARIDDHQWVQTFEQLHPGIPISMVGQPLWGQTAPPLYNVAASSAYDLSWSASQLAILHQDKALDTPMPGALKVTLTYVMGYNGQWELRQVFLHFWPDGNAMPTPQKHQPTPQGCTVNCNPQPTAKTPPQPQGVTSGLTNSAAMTALASHGELNSLQGSLLAASGGSGGNSVITVNGKSYSLGPSLIAAMKAGLAANLRFTFGHSGLGASSLVQAVSNGLGSTVGVATQEPTGMGLTVGTGQSTGFDAFIGVGAGLDPGIGQQLVQNTVTHSTPSVVKNYQQKKV